MRRLLFILLYLLAVGAVQYTFRLNTWQGVAIYFAGLTLALLIREIVGELFEDE